MHFTTELLVISTESGLIVEELPADQFDHIFLRTKLPRGWIYLDATSPFNVFGSPPASLQGLRALILNHDCEIVTLPEDDPELNQMVISEHFTSLNGDRFLGTFSLTLTGSPARWADEHWKTISLRETDQFSGAQTFLTRFFPNQALRDFSKITDTSQDYRLEARGIHERCRLSRLGSRLVGTLRWDDPLLPFEYWRTTLRTKLFEIAVPMIIRIEVIVDEEPFKLLDDLSELASFANDFCAADGEVVHDDGKCIIRRTIVIKRKRLLNEQIESLPESLDALERALQVALCLRT